MTNKKKHVINLVIVVCLALILVLFYLYKQDNDLASDIPSAQINNESASSAALIVDKMNLNTRNDSSSERIAKLEEALIMAIDEISSLKSAINELSNNTSDSSDNTNDLPPRVKLSKEEKRALKEQRIAKLEQRLVNDEQADNAWIIAMEEGINQKLLEVPELKGANNPQIQCGADLCKLSANLPTTMTPFEKDAFNWKLMMSLADELPTSTGSKSIQQDGSETVTYYFSRRGYSLDPVQD